MKYPIHENKTGSFQELAHASDVEFGQLSLLTVDPRCERGGHYHKRKLEWFCCVSGECYLVLATPEGEQIASTPLSEKDKEFVIVRPDQSHTVLNFSNRECTLLVIVSEEFDPDDTDTYKVKGSADG